MQHRKAFSKFIDFRWKEGIGMPYCPYMYRWVLTIFGYSIRVHHWLRSDDKRAFHDHPWWFFTIVLKGGYTDVTPEGRQELSFLSCKLRQAHHNHYVDVGVGGCWSFLVTGRPTRKWGFTSVSEKRRISKNRYFQKFGHPPCHEQ